MERRRWSWGVPRERIYIPTQGAAGKGDECLIVDPHPSSCGEIREGGVYLLAPDHGIVVRFEDLEWLVEQIRHYRAGDHEKIDR